MKAGIDADQVALQIDERAAGVARIDSRVGLDEILEPLHPDVRPVQPADDAGGHGLAYVPGIADGEDEIADLELARVPERDRGGLPPARR